VLTAALQLYHSGAARKNRRPRAWPLTLALQAALVYAFLLPFVAAYVGGLGGFLAGSVLLLTEGPLPGSGGRLAGCDRYVTCLLRDVHCAGCCWRSTVSASVIVIADAPQVPPVTAHLLQDPSVRSRTSFAGLAAARDARIVNRALRFERRTVS